MCVLHITYFKMCVCVYVLCVLNVCVCVPYHPQRPRIAKPTRILARVLDQINLHHRLSVLLGRPFLLPLRVSNEGVVLCVCVCGCM